MTQPDTEYPDDLSEALKAAIDVIDTGTRQAAERFGEIVEQYQRWFWTLPPAVALWIQRRLSLCRERIRVILDKAEQALERHVPVLSLISTGFAWLHDVRRPISAMSHRARETELNLSKWSGDAASRYLTVVDGQRAAIDEVTVRTDFISAWLVRIARANIEYAVELAQVVTQLVARLTQALIEAGSVIALPWAVETLAEATGELVRSGLDNLMGMAERLVEAIGNVRDVESLLTDHSTLPAGRWPEAVRG